MSSFLPDNIVNYVQLVVKLLENCLFLSTVQSSIGILHANPVNIVHTWDSCGRLFYFYFFYYFDPEDFFK